MSTIQEKTDADKVEITISQITVLATMNYANTDTMCAICRKHLMAPTQDDLSKGVLTCKISRGKCKHTFHSDCINKLAKAGNASCPIDYTPWNLEKELDSDNQWQKYPSNDLEDLDKPKFAAKPAVKSSHVAPEKSVVANPSIGVNNPLYELFKNVPNVDSDEDIEMVD